ncbi:MAG: cytochrome c [Verrucomicrobia bacterium]|nr:cytochrome c [Verrucomicrobiota bacterium]
MNPLLQIHIAAALLVSAEPVGLAAAPQPLPNTPSSLHNVFCLTPRVFSGSQPEGDAAFAWLASQGVKTIVSVDGSRPDVETARRHGLRYVHLPVGYNGVSSNRVAELAKVATTLPGPFYVHCHHGKHRGPVAAAVLCEASEKWSASEAEAFIKQAGTSLDYAGLYRSVREFRAPEAETLAGLTNSLPEVAPAPGLVQAMVAVDAQVERLRACQKVGWRTPPEHPDVSPAHEAVQLWEQFRELGRTKEMKDKPASFNEILRATENAADQLRQHLHDASSGPGPESASADAAFRRITDNCAACHKKYRN